MGEMLHHSQFGSLHYGGQTPVTPSTGFFPRSPNLETDALGRRFSQASPHDRTAFGPEFHRARSPTADEARENSLRNGSPVGSLKTASLSQTESPLMGRPPPRYPGQMTSAGSDNAGPLRLVTLRYILPVSMC